MLAGADLAPDAALRTPPASTGFLQDSEVNEDILLPAAGPQDDDPGHSWPRDYFGVAVGAISVQRYSGGGENRVLPGFYVRGRVDGYSFSTRGRSEEDTSELQSLMLSSYAVFCLEKTK